MNGEMKVVSLADRNRRKYNAMVIEACDRLVREEDADKRGELLARKAAVELAATLRL